MAILEIYDIQHELQSAQRTGSLLVYFIAGIFTALDSKKHLKKLKPPSRK
jgi:hypothetical protein